MNIKVIIYGIILVAYTSCVFWLGGEHSRKELAETKMDQAILLLQASTEQQKNLQKTLDTLPKSEGTIREIVRTNPANCSMPQPVVDGLQGAIDKANAARKMPTDS